MQIEELQNFRLVGGKALALQLGHRTSVDIDLFTDRSFDTNQILRAISSQLQVEQITRTQIGITFFTDDIKVDLCNWSVPFLGQPIIYDHIRMSPPGDIAVMKLDAITSRKDKKDYYDLYFLLAINTFAFYLDCYRAKYPYNNIKNVVAALANIDDSDSSPKPQLVEPLDWEKVK